MALQPARTNSPQRRRTSHHSRALQSRQPHHRTVRRQRLSAAVASAGQVMRPRRRSPARPASAELVSATANCEIFRNRTSHRHKAIIRHPTEKMSGSGTGSRKPKKLEVADYAPNVPGERVLTCGEGEQLGHPGRTVTKKPRAVGTFQEGVKLVQVSSAPTKL